MSSMWYTLADGPLRGQEVRIFGIQGGGLPTLIVVHAPVPPGETILDVRRHLYRLRGQPKYAHYRHDHLCHCPPPVDAPAD
jgi:hypothetical protein